MKTNDASPRRVDSSPYPSPTTTPTASAAPRAIPPGPPLARGRFTGLQFFDALDARFPDTAAQTVAEGGADVDAR